MPLAERPLSGFAHCGEGLDQKVVDLLSGGQPRAERVGARAQCRVVELFHTRLERVDRLDVSMKLLQVTVVRRSEGPFDQTEDHTSTSNPFVLTSPAGTCPQGDAGSGGR